MNKAGVFLALTIFAAMLLTGCVSKSQAQAQARMAYLQGRRDAEQRFQDQLANPAIKIIGPVRNPSVEWVEGLTVVHAIVAAEYASDDEPRRIVIRRTGQEIEIDPQRLLRGDDYPLQPGDTVELVR